MFADFDRACREMGTGDLSVGKHETDGTSLLRRIRAYEEGSGEAMRLALGAALARNPLAPFPDRRGLPSLWPLPCAAR
jgi:hypothetical protein